MFIEGRDLERENIYHSISGPFITVVVFVRSGDTPHQQILALLFAINIILADCKIFHK